MTPGIMSAATILHFRRIAMSTATSASPGASTTADALASSPHPAPVAATSAPRPRGSRRRRPMAAAKATRTGGNEGVVACRSGGEQELGRQAKRRSRRQRRPARSAEAETEEKSRRGAESSPQKVGHARRPHGVTSMSRGGGWLRSKVGARSTSPARKIRIGIEAIGDAVEAQKPVAERHDQVGQRRLEVLVVHPGVGGPDGRQSPVVEQVTDVGQVSRLVGSFSGRNQEEEQKRRKEEENEDADDEPTVPGAGCRPLAEVHASALYADATIFTGARAQARGRRASPTARCPDRRSGRRQPAPRCCSLRMKVTLRWTR